MSREVVDLNGGNIDQSSLDVVANGYANIVKIGAMNIPLNVQKS